MILAKEETLVIQRPGPIRLFEVCNDASLGAAWDPGRELALIASEAHFNLDYNTQPMTISVATTLQLIMHSAHYYC